MKQVRNIREHDDTASHIPAVEQNTPSIRAVPADAAAQHPEAGPDRVETGFVPTHPRLHRVYNITLGTLLLLAALPAIATIGLALLMTQGWRVFYRGPRMGLRGARYDIIKFRTLNGQKAKEITKAGVLPAGSGIETPLGGFLRDTRLDELPQLLNVALGQMNICGPRPVRPEIAEIQRLHIPNYDARFDVRPGLIGPTQAYMHHGTSKAIRARYNALLCQAPVRYLGELKMVVLVGSCVLARTATKIWHRLSDALLGTGPETRAAATAANAGLVIRVDDKGTEYPVSSIDRATLSLTTDTLFLEPVEVPIHGYLDISLPDGQARSAAVELVPVEEGLYAYKARTDFAHHVISRYLWQAVVVPHKSHLLSAELRRRIVRLMTPGRRGVVGQPAFARAMNED